MSLSWRCSQLHQEVRGMRLHGGQAAQNAAGGHFARPIKVDVKTCSFKTNGTACRQQQQQTKLLNNACIARLQVPGSHRAQHYNVLCPSPGYKVACQNPQHASHLRKPEHDLHICCRYLQAGLHGVSSPHKAQSTTVPPAGFPSHHTADMPTHV